MSLHELFGGEAAAASTSNPEKNARIVVATYQTLGVAGADDDATFLTKHYPENYFSHIIIDEAHRSAWDKWSQVLTRNAASVQIGLTATPREFEYAEDTVEARNDREVTADNIKYFGKPVYEYSIAQGIEDGYLAAMEVRSRDVFLEGYAESEQVTGLTQEDLEGKPLRDAVTGEKVTTAEARAHYRAVAFESRLVMPERVGEMCEDLFAQLVETGRPEQKTIVFCASDAHADAVANAMNNLYARWGGPTRSAQSNYAFKCTAAAHDNHLPEFKDNQAQYFIATTVDLLSTGVDVPAVRNVVFFRYVKSPVSFHQMVGRGTRIHPATDKYMFRIYDYTNAARLLGEDFKRRISPERPEGDVAPGGPRPGGGETRIEVRGVDVRVTGAGTSVLTRGEDGIARLMTIEQYTERLAAKLVEDVPALDDFRATWVDPGLRRRMMERLPDEGGAPYVVRQFTLGEDYDRYDLYDVLAHAAFGQAPKTRVDRADAFAWKNRDWLDGMPERASGAVRAIASQFAKGGTENLENPLIFSTPEVREAGGVSALRTYASPSEALRQAKLRMFRA